MHVGIDIREACAERKTGKGRWAEGFVRELLTRGIRTSLFSDVPVPDAWSDEVAAAGANAVVVSERGARWHLAVARMLRPSGIQCYVSPTSYLVPALAGGSVPCVPVIHDLIAFRPEAHDRKAKFIERLTLGRAVARSRFVCTVSEATRRDLLERYPRLDPSSVRAIFAGGGELPAVPSSSDGKTIVCIGTLCPRKNQLRLLQAFDRLPSPLRERCTLVLVGGRGWDDDDIVAAARRIPGVTWKDYLPDADVEALLGRSAVFALPSLYEGFGFPLLDAMRRAIPIVSSDRGSLKEVAGDAAFYVDPEDVPSIARGLERVLTDDPLRSSLAEAGAARRGRFTWKATVDLFLEGLAD